MRLTDVFSAQSVALNRTEVESNRIPFLGTAWFPNRKKMGIDLGWIKTHKGLGVALKPANFDTLAPLRTRQGISMTKQQMPFYRESMIVKEQDMIDIMRVREANDPYIDAVLTSIYDDTNNLVDGADIAAERMRMQLLCPANGELGISVSADGVIYNYDYDSDGTWKSKNYVELTTSSDKWDAPTTAKPLDNLRAGIQYLASIGVTAQTILSNSSTFDLLLECDQMKNALVTLSGVAVNFMDTDTVEEIIRRKLKVEWLTYDKMYKDYDDSEKKFYLDDYVTIIGSGQLGSTWYGTTPEERTLLGDPKVDVSVLDRGVAIAVKTDYGPPVLTSTTVSQIVLPSFEGMDSIYVSKVK